MLFFMERDNDTFKNLRTIPVTSTQMEMCIRDRVPYGETVAEQASVPVVKAASIHHEQTPPVRTERQIVPSASLAQPNERQKTAPTITQATPRPARPVQNLSLIHI